MCSDKQSMQSSSDASPRMRIQSGPRNELKAIKLRPKLTPMPACPICSLPLVTTRHLEGLIYHCSRCDGRAVTMPHVRRIAGDRFAARLLRLIQLVGSRSELRCPFCDKPMRVETTKKPPLQVDGCLACNAVWLDAPTFESLSGGIVETTSSLPL